MTKSRPPKEPPRQDWVAGQQPLPLSLGHIDPPETTPDVVVGGVSADYGRGYDTGIAIGSRAAARRADNHAILGGVLAKLLADPHVKVVITFWLGQLDLTDSEVAAIRRLT